MNLPKRQRRRRRGRRIIRAQRAKLPFPINLIFNMRAFYMFFIVVMIASVAAVGLVPGGTGEGRLNVPIPTGGVPEATPAR